jgi:sugar phosphate isomerase/epimerase
MTRLGLKLGFDNYSIRALDWKAPQLLDYAASLRLDTVLFSDLDVYESFSEGYLRGIKAKADDLGIEIQAGTGGIDRTSGFWKGKWGPPEKLLRTTIRVAKILGSSVARCYLGWVGDRKPKVGLWPHIARVVRTCKSVRSFAKDCGVRIAVENHAGDMHSTELIALIEEAGRDYVGATMDSGNAVWALEDPSDTLEVLGPAAVSTGIRDSAVWETPTGAAFEWKAMGAGQVDWKAYFKRYAQICPKTPVQLEIITGPSRDLPYFQKDFWGPWHDVPVARYARYVAFARSGKAPKPYRTPKGLRAEQAWQKQQLEKSLSYCKQLGLGLKR